MTVKEELLAAFDDAWSHRWESFEANLKNLTDDEAAYQSPTYSNESRDLREPPNGTILWHLIHVGQCYLHYSGMISERPVRPPEPEPPQVNTVSEAIESLKQIRSEFRSIVAMLGEEQLSEKVANGDTVQEFIRTCIRHEVWHIAQMAMARRLYRMSK